MAWSQIPITKEWVSTESEDSPLSISYAFCRAPIILSPLSITRHAGVASTSCTVTRLGKQHVGCPGKTPHLPHSTASGDGGVADDAGFPERDQTDENRSPRPSEVSEVSELDWQGGTFAGRRHPLPGLHLEKLPPESHKTVQEWLFSSLNCFYTLHDYVMLLFLSLFTSSLLIEHTVVAIDCGY